jgi:hypothetical protein
MVSPNTPPDAPRNHESTPALRASLLDFAAPPMAGSRRPGHVEHEKMTFFHSCKTPAAEASVKAAPAPPQRAERSGEPLRMPERRVRRVSAKKPDSPRLSTKNHD